VRRQWPKGFDDSGQGGLTVQRGYDGVVTRCDSVVTGCDSACQECKGVCQGCNGAQRRCEGTVVHEIGPTIKVAVTVDECG
jgi:hypothetical protein